MSRTPTGTRERLLNAACELISEKGYLSTTHQDICDRAEANIASINYYFGSKEKLHEAVWERAFEEKLRAHSVDPDLYPDPMEALAAHVRCLIEEVLDEGPGGWLPKLIFHAVHEGGQEELRGFIHSRMAPLKEQLEATVEAVLGPRASDFHVQCCAFSVHSQCVHLNAVRRRGHGPLAEGLLSDTHRDALVENLATFIMGGVKQVRAQIHEGVL